MGLNHVRPRICSLAPVLYAPVRFRFLSVLRVTSGTARAGQQTHAAIHAFKFFEQQIFISWICVPAMTTLRTNKAFVIHPPDQRRCRLLALNALPSNAAADMRPKQILRRIGKQKLVG
jgi:hypothetical protein